MSDPDRPTERSGDADAPAAGQPDLIEWGSAEASPTAEDASEAVQGLPEPSVGADDSGDAPQPPPGSLEAATWGGQPETGQQRSTAPGSIGAPTEDDEGADPGALEGIAVSGAIDDEDDEDDDDEDDGPTHGMEHVKADRVVIKQGGAGQVEAREVRITQGGAGQVRADRVSIFMGGVGFARAGELELGAEANAFIVVADEVKLEDGGRVVLLLARRASGDVRPTIDLRSAAVFGAAFAVVGALLRRWRGR